MYAFGNSKGQPYTVSGWNTNLRRLMGHAETKAKKEGSQFQRFTLKDMRPAAVTDRVEEGTIRSRTLPGTAAIGWCGRGTTGGRLRQREQLNKMLSKETVSLNIKQYVCRNELIQEQ